MGTTLSVIAFFRVELARLLGAGVRSLAHRAPFESAEAKLAWLIAAGTVPAALAGFVLEKRIEGLGNYVIAGSLVVLGLVLLLAEIAARHARSLSELGLTDAILVGIG